MAWPTLWAASSAEKVQPAAFLAANGTDDSIMERLDANLAMLGLATPIFSVSAACQMTQTAANSRCVFDLQSYWFAIDEADTLPMTSELRLHGRRASPKRNGASVVDEILHGGLTFLLLRRRAASGGESCLMLKSARARPTPTKPVRLAREDAVGLARRSTPRAQTGSSTQKPWPANLPLAFAQASIWAPFAWLT